MNSIVSINKEEDISKITKETKYINIPIDIVDNNINNYFIINGVDYSYSENKALFIQIIICLNKVNY